MNFLNLVAKGGIDMLTNLGTQALFAAFDGSEDSWRSIAAKQTGAALTGAEREANAFAAEEAEKARQFSEMQRQTQYQTAVNDMQAAGLNPAMMYQGAGAAASPTPAAAATPAGSGSQNGMNMIDAMLKLAEISNVNAETKKVEAETKGQELSNSWYDELSAAKVREMGATTENMLQAVKVGASQVEVNGKLVDLYDAQKELFGAQVGKVQAECVLTWLNANGQAVQNAILRASKDDLIRLNKAKADYEEALKAYQNAAKENQEAQANAANAAASKYIAEAEKIGIDTSIETMKKEALEDFREKFPNASEEMWIAQTVGNGVSYSENLAFQAADAGVETVKELKKKNKPQSAGRTHSSHK